MAVLVLSGQRQIEMLMRPFDQQQPVCQASLSSDPVCLSRRWKTVGCGPMTSAVTQLRASGRLLAAYPPSPPRHPFSPVNKTGSLMENDEFGKEIPNEFLEEKKKGRRQPRMTPKRFMTGRQVEQREKKRSRWRAREWIYSWSPEGRDLWSFCVRKTSLWLTIEAGMNGSSTSRDVMEPYQQQCMYSHGNLLWLVRQRSSSHLKVFLWGQIYEHASDVREASLHPLC